MLVTIWPILCAVAPPSTSRDQELGNLRDHLGKLFGFLPAIDIANHVDRRLGLFADQIGVGDDTDEAAVVHDRKVLDVPLGHGEQGIECEVAVVDGRWIRRHDSLNKGFAAGALRHNAVPEIDVGEDSDKLVPGDNRQARDAMIAHGARRVPDGVAGFDGHRVRGHQVSGAQRHQVDLDVAGDAGARLGLSQTIGAHGREELVELGVLHLEPTEFRVGQQIEYGGFEGLGVIGRPAVAEKRPHSEGFSIAETRPELSFRTANFNGAGAHEKQKTAILSRFEEGFAAG